MCVQRQWLKQFYTNKTRIMRKSYLILIFILTITSVAKSQKIKTLAVDSGIAYLKFRAGGSTARIGYLSYVLDTAKSVKKINISKSDIDTLNRLFATIKSKRHYQQKIGQSYYLKLYMGQSSYRVAFFPGYCLLDIQNKREYRLTKPEDANFILRFIARNKL